MNPKPIVVKVVNAMPIPLPKNAIDIGIILMTMILRRTSASNTIPTIKAKQLCFALWSKKSSNESMIKSMAKKITEKYRNIQPNPSLSMPRQEG